MIVRESGMIFGPYRENDFFYIEKSRMLQKTQNASTVEFIWHPKKTLLYFVEAKTSAPKQEEDLNAFLAEIAKKFTDSLQLFLAGRMGRKLNEEEIGENIRNLEYKNINYRFFLIIRNYQQLWLPPLKELLQKELLGFRSIWNCEIFVFNEELAQESGLIAESELPGF